MWHGVACWGSGTTEPSVVPDNPAERHVGVGRGRVLLRGPRDNVHLVRRVRVAELQYRLVLRQQDVHVRQLRACVPGLLQPAGLHHELWRLLTPVRCEAMHVCFTC